MTTDFDPPTADRSTPTRSSVCRRTFCRRAGVAGAVAGLAGCLDALDASTEGDEGDGSANSTPTDRALAPSYPEIEDPPAAVYVPTHRESMRPIEPIEVGEYVLAPMLSYPHPFWLVDGRVPTPVEPNGDHGVHLMITLRDAETGVVLPADSGAEIRVERAGDPVGAPRQPWPMLSQEMGVHVGDNVPLERFGTHTVEVTVPPSSVETTGEFEGRFTETVAATFSFEYDEAFLEAVVGGVEYLPEDHWGRRGALEPAADEASLPPSTAYPGTLLEPATDDGLVDDDGRDASEGAGGLPITGDATVVTTVLRAGAKLADGDGPSLLVSPRTRYNRFPLANLALSVAVERAGAVVEEGPLSRRLDHEVGLHYERPVPALEPGDSVTITVESPPQVARHRGYETAFLEMPPVSLTVPEVG